MRTFLDKLISIFFYEFLFTWINIEATPTQVQKQGLSCVKH